MVFATALVILGTIYLFRFIYHATGHARAGRLPMFKLLSAPKVDWMAKHRIFWTISAVVVTVGVLFAYQKLYLNTSEVLDIEFIGGTSVQIELKEQEQGLTDEQVGKFIYNDRDIDDRATAVGWLRQAGTQIKSAQVSRLDDQTYALQLPSGLGPNQAEALLLPVFEPKLVRGGIRAEGDRLTLSFQQPRREADEDPKPGIDLAGVQALLGQAGDYARTAADKMRGTRVQLVTEETAGGQERKAFELITTETSRRLVAEAVQSSMLDKLEVTPSISSVAFKDPARSSDGLFPIRQGDNTLADVLGPQSAGLASGESVAQFKGGVALVLEQLSPPVTKSDLTQRMRAMRLQPDFEAGFRDSDVIGLEPATPGPVNANTRFRKIAVVVKDDALPFTDDPLGNEAWRTRLAEKELALVQAALSTPRTFQRVTTFAPQVAGEAAMKAVIAIILSLIAIAIYLWARFGSAEFGLAGIIALYHDVAVALTALLLSHYLWDTWIGRLLMLEDFKIDLSVVAALLTIVGFSINDTIVIFDRIRENRGRNTVVSAELVNRSLNETMSRTIITTLTVLMTVAVMYFFGGDGIHSFAFVMLAGCISGTYSTIAIATPLVQNPRALWLVSIFLGGLTALGLALTVSYVPLQIGLVVIVLALSAYALYRVFSEGAEPRRTVPA